MKVSVVVPAYNSAKTIGNAVEALLAQDYPKENLEIILVDDGSDDETGEIVKKYPVKYLYQKNKGPAVARNLGWKFSSSNIVCFTDSDCVPEKDWISKIIKAYTSEQIAGVGGSYDIVNSESLFASCIHEEIVQRHLKMPKEVNYLGAFNVSYRRSILEEVGGFNESYSDASGEDNDVAYRVVKKGYTLIFDKNIRVGHYHPTSLLRYLKQQFKHGFWRMKLYKDHPDMSKGDVYAGLLGFVQPPLALLTLLLLPFLFIRSVTYLFCSFLIVQAIMQLVMPFLLIKRTKKAKYIYLTFITFLREYSRGIGMAIGIWRFRVCNS